MQKSIYARHKAFNHPVSFLIIQGVVLKHLLWGIQWIATSGQVLWTKLPSFDSPWDQVYERCLLSLPASGIFLEDSSKGLMQKVKLQRLW